MNIATERLFCVCGHRGELAREQTAALFAGQQLAQAISKNDPSWTILRSRLNPLLYFLEMDSMFDRLAHNGDAKLGHRARNVGDDFTLPEFGYGECNGFVERICVYLDRVDDAISIGIRNPAARKSHRSNYTHVFAFISPQGTLDPVPAWIVGIPGLQTITPFTGSIRRKLESRFFG